jgi:hypothetical protein
LVAIIPWFTLVATIISVIVLFRAANERPTHRVKADMKEVSSDEKLSNGV